MEGHPAHTHVARREQANGLARYLSILGWLPAYRGEWLRGDLLAGLIVVALLVTEGMAYSELAGMPPQAAFCAAPAGLVLCAIFSTSRQLVVAVPATVAAMSAAAVGPLAAQGSAEFAALTALLALAVGAASVLSGVLKLGRIAQFFSESVLTSFVSGLALVIAIRQVPELFGIEAGGEGCFERLWEIIVRLPQTHLPTLLVGVATLAVMIVLERSFGRIPAALLALVAGIVVSALLNVSRTPESRPVPGLLIVRPNEGIIFANAAPLHERISLLIRASDRPPRAVLLDLEMSSELDAPGADTLAELHEELGQRGIGLLLSRAHPQVRETLDRSGVTARIGENHIHRCSIAAVRDFVATPGTEPAPERE